MRDACRSVDAMAVDHRGRPVRRRDMIRNQKVTLLAGVAVVATALGGGATSVFAQSPAASSAAVAGLPATPTGYTELDQALGAGKPLDGKKVTMQTQWIQGE